MTSDDEQSSPSPRLGELPSGTVFAGYRIERVLGHGGMGTVYVARHPRLPRYDVLKLLSPSFSNDPNFRARFEREADLASSLEHRNIVSVYDRGSQDGQLWIAMRYVRGYDASALISAHPGGIDPDFAVGIISEVGAALDHAHRRGMVHRDVKPANILIEAEDDGSIGAIMLTDFGIARAVDDAMHLTDTGLTVASVPYASPEQLHGYELDGRADIYALAATFVELVTGLPPYPRDNRLAAMSAHLHDAPPRISDRVSGLPRELDEVIRSALAKNPADRYRRCAEFTRAVAVALRMVPGPTPSSASLPTTTLASEASQPHDDTPTSPIEAAVGNHPPTSVASDPRFGQASGRVFSPTGNPDTATQLVGVRSAGVATRSGQLHTAADDRHGQGDRRMTTILISVATVLTVLGVIAGVLAYLDRSPDLGTWDQSHQSIADTFGSLLPAGPKGQGWQDSSCKADTSEGLAAIACTASTGVDFTVWSTPTAQARGVVTTTIGNQPGTERIWTDGPVFVSPERVTDGWVITNFTDTARSPYTIVAMWEGHTGQQVLDDWWVDAPFET